MSCIATQTTTFLPKVIPVLQKKVLGKSFIANMKRIHKSAVKSAEDWSKKRVKNKKIFASVVKEMTQIVRKRKTAQRKVEAEVLKLRREAKREAKRVSKCVKPEVKPETIVKDTTYKIIFSYIVSEMVIRVREWHVLKAKIAAETLKHKKTFTKIVKEMTLLIRKRRTTLRKADAKLLEIEKNAKRAKRLAEKLAKAEKKTKSVSPEFITEQEYAKYLYAGKIH